MTVLDLLAEYDYLSWPSPSTVDPKRDIGMVSADAVRIFLARARKLGMTSKELTKLITSAGGRLDMFGGQKVLYLPLATDPKTIVSQSKNSAVKKSAAPSPQKTTTPPPVIARLPSPREESSPVRETHKEYDKAVHAELAVVTPTNVSFYGGESYPLTDFPTLLDLLVFLQARTVTVPTSTAAKNYRKGAKTKKSFINPWTPPLIVTSLSVLNHFGAGIDTLTESNSDEITAQLKSSLLNDQLHEYGVEGDLSGHMFLKLPAQGASRPAGLRIILTEFIRVFDPRKNGYMADRPSWGEILRRLELFHFYFDTHYRINPGTDGLWLLSGMNRARKEVHSSAVRKAQQSGKKNLPLPPYDPRDPSHDDIPFDLLISSHANWMNPYFPPSGVGKKMLIRADRNADYLAAARNARIGIGSVQWGYREFDKNIEGFWKITDVDWPVEILPQPFTSTEVAVVPTVMLDFMHSHNIRYTLEGVWAYPHYKTLLRPWAEKLDHVRSDLIAHPDSITHKALLAHVKAMYTQAIGQFVSKNSTHELYRPEWQRVIVATSQVRILSAIWECLEQTGRTPLAVRADEIVYAVDPGITNLPGFNVGTNPGTWKWREPVEFTDKIGKAAATKNLIQFYASLGI